MPELFVPDASERDDLGAFVARAVRLEQSAPVRLRQRRDDEDRLDLWVSTPFDALVTRSVAGRVTPSDLTVSGSELLAALAVVGGERMDPGVARDLLWRSALPPVTGWTLVDEVPAAVLGDLADRGVALAREHVGPQGTPPASLLDQTVLTVSGGGFDVSVPLRCLFALSGMGFVSTASAGPGPRPGGESVLVRATDSWLRIDARYGAVVRRRHALLPLLV
ncbi:MAG TPA: hypothetical protein VGD67_08790 [Pseudonocardiaceae bacterium]